MYAYLLVFAAIAIPLYLGNRRRKQSNDKQVQHYEAQNVKFVQGDESYVKTMKQELEADRPHFDSLRQVASSDVTGTDYLGIKMEDQTWLFPVSQKHLKDFYAMSAMGGKMETIPFNQAIGYAPEGMPFIHTNDHWKELRKNVAAIFHSSFMDAYMQHFNNSVKELAAKWRGESGKSVNLAKDITDMAFNSAAYSLIGSKLDVDVPYVKDGETKTMHIRDVNHQTLNDFAQHAATVEFIKDNNYKAAHGSQQTDDLNKNMGTLAGALTGLVEARVAEIQSGAESHTTIVDAAISLTLKGVIKSVGEAIQHGWAILNGAHSNCGNALAATLYYLLKNPAKMEILKKEIESQLIKGRKLDESNLDEVVTRENLKDLSYLSYVVKEALRLSSPIYGKPMQAKEDIQLDGLNITKDTIVFPNNGVLGVSENIWKDPLEFIPERFDPESDYFRLPDGSKREPITFLAFGAGSRTCMGDNYSMYFVKVGLVYFLHLFDFELTKEPEVDSFFYWLNDRQFSGKVATK